MHAHVNWIAAVVAGIVGFFPGAAWYSNLLFLKAWQAETGLTGQESKLPQGARVGIGLALSILAAILFAWLMGPDPQLGFAVGAGLIVGVGFITTAFGVQYLFEGRSVRLTLINGAYHTLQFAIFGLILGLWH